MTKMSQRSRRRIQATGRNIYDNENQRFPDNLDDPVEGSDPHLDDPENQVPELQRDPKGMKLPKPPNYEEIEKHRLTHLPYQPWCSECVINRGRDKMHKQIPREFDEENDSLEIQLDYTFLKTSGEDRQTTCLIGICPQTGYVFSHKVPKKGPGVPGISTIFKSWLLEARLMDAILQTRGDAERGLLALIEKFVREIKVKMKPGSAAARSSESVGSVSRPAGALNGLVRTYISQYEKNWSVKVKASDPITAWAVRHAGWCLNRYNVSRKTGLTPFETVNHQTYKSDLVPFGSAVFI